MRHKKLAIFLTSLVLVLFLLPFLLIYEGSPLNRYFREEDAKNAYNEAIQFYEEGDYQSATSTLRRLLDEDGRGFWGHYHDTDCVKNVRAEASELLPAWYCEWAEELYADGRIDEAVGRLSYVLNQYPEYQSQFVTSRIRDMEIDCAGRAKNAMEITLPEGTSKSLGDYSELIIINDSPKQLNVFLRGPINMSMTIDANNKSSYHAVPPMLPSWCNHDVNETLTLPPGNFEMAIDARLTIPAYGEFKLLANQSYELVFYILRDYT